MPVPSALPTTDPAWLKPIREASSAVTSKVVAVLDTGVAYETWGGFTAADTLSSTAFTAPYDFINDDNHPNDDNEHGTHIASLIASSGAVTGVAAGVSLTPTTQDPDASTV